MVSQSWNRADANLLPENIKNGVSIFGVNGTYSSSRNIGRIYLWWYAINISSRSLLNEWTRTIDIWDKIVFFSGMSLMPTWASYSWLAWNVCILNKLDWSISYITPQEQVISGNSNNYSISDSYVDWTDIYINFTGPSVSGVFSIDTDANTFVINTWNITTGILDNSTSTTLWWKTLSVVIEKYSWQWLPTSYPWYSSYIDVV